MIPKRVRCPQCGTVAEYKIDNPSRPFCSERCKLIDLGAWAEERYSIPGAVAFSDLDGLFPDADLDSPPDDLVVPPTSNKRFNS